MQKINCLSSEIFIGNNFLDPSFLKPKDCFLVTEETVFSYQKPFILSLNIPVKVIPPGELSKSREIKSEIEDFLLEAGCSKTSTLVAFGGGVISDICGFVASTFMRGIELILIPTSLLAMADSTIGGKNAVDTKHGKNLIGSIYRPKSVFIDTQFLSSLNRQMWAAGMAEILKISMLLDAELYTTLKNSSLTDLMNDKDMVLNTVKRAIELKASVVEQDEHESKLRMILNFGHTVGHALEAAVKDLNHGLCVAIGMFAEIEIAYFLDKTEIEPEEFKETLNSFDLPWRIPDIDALSLISKAKLDKKKRSSEIPIYVPYKIGCISPDPLLLTDQDFLVFSSNTLKISGQVLGFSDVRIPGSKSLTNRFILLASLCREKTVIKDPLISEDTLVMIDCLTKLGVCKIDRKNNTLEVTGLEPCQKDSELYVSNAGTVARFLSTTCMLLKGNTVIRGSQRMHERPIKDLIEALNFNSCRGVYLEKPGFLPIQIIGGGFTGGEMAVNCSISSQYVSSILMASPLAESETVLNLTERSEPTSYSYIKMTVSCMKLFGAEVEVLSPTKYIIKNKGYRSPGVITVEPDAGSASYFFALSAANDIPIEIPGLGSSSLQGELEFLQVLTQMGCQVTQSEASTSIKGKVQSPVKVDMNNCTDSFITAAVLMALCEGKSEITGIANQRLKESNRIQAVANELLKLGVFCEETESGLIINGKKNLEKGAVIKTYNDHRLAMAFSLFGSVAGWVLIHNKQVVSKTFPGFWKNLKKTGLELLPPERKTPRNLVLIGMRGVGKSSLAAFAASEIGWKLVDIDEKIKARTGTEISEWVQVNGFQKFRELEFEEIEKYLKEDETVIVCGGGAVESDKSFGLLFSHFPVVWVRSSLENIKKNLENGSNEHRAVLNFEEAYARRKKRFEKAADFQFYYKKRDFEKVSQNFFYFCQRLFGHPAQTPPNFSAFGCITEQTSEDLIENSRFLTALEIRADCYKTVQRAFKNLGSAKELIPGVQTIFTFRSVFSKSYWKTLKKSLTFLPDYIDVQFEPSFDWFLNYSKLKKSLYSTRVILSYHTEFHCSLNSIYTRMHELKPDIVKFIAPFTVHPAGRPEILFALGQNPLTRIQNIFFSPVRVDQPMGKGQLSYEELLEYQEKFLIKPKSLKFYLAGNNISRSPAKTLYSGLFSHYGLDYSIEYLETNEIETVVSVLKESSCLGMLITIPFKEKIMQFLDRVSDEALMVGSVNTVVKYKDLLIGHNTDWCGLYYPIKNWMTGSVKAAILGAGGTGKAAFFALQKLGVKDVVVWNRSTARLEGWNCRTTTDLDEVAGCKVIISTLPGDSEVILHGIGKEDLIVEAAYFPDPTFIGKQAIDNGCCLVTGKEMYVYMAVYQFALFTGRNVCPSLVRRFLKW